jgi:hypothetical protein
MNISSNGAIRRIIKSFISIAKLYLLKNEIEYLNKKKKRGREFNIFASNYCNGHQLGIQQTL